VFGIAQSYCPVSVLDDQGALSDRDKDYSVLDHRLARVPTQPPIILGTSSLFLSGKVGRA